MSKPYEIVIGMADTDAAGFLFFASLFPLMQRAYEYSMKVAGLPLSDMLENQTYLTVVVHAEADFKQRVVVDDPLQINLEEDYISDHSFGINYNIYRNSILVAVGKTSHVVISKKSGAPQLIPIELKKVIKGLNS